MEFSCTTALPKSDESSVEFNISKTDQYTDLSRAYLYICVQLLNKDGTVLMGDDTCTLINNAGYGIFDSVDVFISDQRITKPESHYLWWTYIYNLLYYSDNAKMSYLQTGNLWHKDTPGRMDDVDLLNDTFKNMGMKDRQSVCGDSKKVWLCTKVLLNTQLDRLLPSQTEITVRFNRASTKLCLLANEQKDYVIKILDAKLHVNKVKLFDAIHRDAERLLQSTGFFYPAMNPVVRSKTASRGDQNIDWTVFQGKLPQRLYFCMLKQSAYNGQLDRNPYNFKTFDISRLQIYCNGRCVPYAQGLTSMDESRQYLKFWMITLQSINSPETVGIDYLDYTSGYFIVVVDLSSDFSSGCDYNKIDEYGSLRIVADFKTPLTETITLLVLGEIQETLKLDGDRNPSFI